MYRSYSILFSMCLAICLSGCASYFSDDDAHDMSDVVANEPVRVVEQGSIRSFARDVAISTQGDVKIFALDGEQEALPDVGQKQNYIYPDATLAPYTGRIRDYHRAPENNVQLYEFGAKGYQPSAQLEAIDGSSEPGVEYDWEKSMSVEDPDNLY